MQMIQNTKKAILEAEQGYVLLCTAVYGAHYAQ